MTLRAIENKQESSFLLAFIDILCACSYHTWWWGYVPRFYGLSRGAGVLGSPCSVGETALSWASRKDSLQSTRSMKAPRIPQDVSTFACRSPHYLPCKHREDACHQWGFRALWCLWPKCQHSLCIHDYEPPLLVPCRRLYHTICQDHPEHSYIWRRDQNRLLCKCSGQWYRGPKYCLKEWEFKITRLEISMHYPFIVHVGHGREYRFNQCTRLPVWEPSIFEPFSYQIS